MWSNKRDRYSAYALCWTLMLLMTGKLVLLLGINHFGWDVP